MAKIKYTKTELKKQRDALKQFTRFLPTLQLKKQQLQVEVQRTLDETRKLLAKKQAEEYTVAEWAEILARPEFESVQSLLRVREIVKSSKNIAGIDVPVLDSVAFDQESYDLFVTDPWVDHALNAMRRLFELKMHEHVLKEELRLLEAELRTTTQRVNLFEKVKIPEAKENIRVIQIALGDEQTAAVCRSKIAKRKAVAASPTEGPV